jgi:hypothetical protein
MHVLPKCPVVDFRKKELEKRGVLLSPAAPYFCHEENRAPYQRGE